RADVQLLGPLDVQGLVRPGPRPAADHGPGHRPGPAVREESRRGVRPRWRLRPRNPPPRLRPPGALPEGCPGDDRPCRRPHVPARRDDEVRPRPPARAVPGSRRRVPPGGRRRRPEAGFGLTPPRGARTSGEVRDPAGPCATAAGRRDTAESGTPPPRRAGPPAARPGPTRGQSSNRTVLSRTPRMVSTVCGVGEWRML